MKKKYFLFLTSTFLLVACSTSSIPARLKTALDPINFNYAFSNDKSCNLTAGYEEYDADKNFVGSNSVQFSFATDEDNKDIYIHILRKFAGNKITGEITSEEYTINYDNEKYYKKTSINEADPKTIEIDYQSAYGSLVNIFYSKDTTYKYGGLYYGDYFAANANKYYSYYTVNDDGTITFEAEDSNFFEGANSIQKLIIDKYGMLLYCDEKMTSNNNGSYATQVINAEYNVETNF
jgi:hypothetical protein